MMNGDAISLLEIAQSIADNYSVLPEVKAVALAGSVTGGSVDHGSDIDLYVYADIPLPVDWRTAIANARSR